MKGHMNQEEVQRYADSVYEAMRTQNGFSVEQCRRICTRIVAKIGSLKKAKQEDLEQVSE